MYWLKAWCHLEARHRVLTPLLKVQKIEVEKIVIGHPGLFDEGITPVIQSIEDFKKRLEESVGLEIIFHDESFSSMRAKQVLLHSGIKKKKRQEKGLLDKVSAVLILQDYLGHI